MSCLTIRLLGAWLAAAIMVLSNWAWGNSGTVVTISSDHSKDADFFLRMRLELEALGFRVQSAPEQSEPLSRFQLELDTAKTGAAIHYKYGDKQIHVWVHDLSTGKTVMRTTPVDISDNSDIGPVVLSAIELLRASLIELRYQDSPVPIQDFSTEEVPLEPQLEQEIVPRATGPYGWVLVQIGTGVSFVSFDTGPSMLILAGVHVSVTDYLRIGVIGHLPIVNSRKNVASGEISVFPWFVGGEVVVVPGKYQWRVRPYLGVGMGASFFKVVGDAASQEIGDREDTLVSSLLFGTVGIWWRFTAFLSLQSCIVAGWTTVDNTISVDDQVVAVLGSPWVTAFLNFELAVW